MSFKIPHPTLQINFASLLTRMGSLCLQKSLFETVAKVDISDIDEELSRLAPKESLSVLAQHGLRGELVFAVPLLLSTNPYLLGYYRLLLGFSQKEFYTKAFDCARFKPMEMKGKLSPANASSLPALCEGLTASAVALIKGLNEDNISISRGLLSDLTLITLGAQSDFI